MSLYDALRDALEAEQPMVVATVISETNRGAKLLVYPDSSTLGFLGPHVSETTVVHDALAMLATAQSGTRTYPTATGTVAIFIESYPAPPTLYIVGAVHVAISLVTFARTLGFRTVVIDARGVFASPERFAHADELLIAWPDEVLEGRLNHSSYVVLLTHDPKFDDPVIKLALAGSVAYLGALGSKRTHANRLERLREAGLSEAQLARIYAPIGLAIGAKTPEEIAVSIMAEIVAVRHQRRG
ncbi:MAG: xanthine dehydrogenase [Blastochloris sp.]|nr:xanthine dehydrogenase [Blastochloris sp.]